MKLLDIALCQGSSNRMSNYKHNAGIVEESATTSLVDDNRGTSNLVAIKTEIDIKNETIEQ